MQTFRLRNLVRHWRWFAFVVLVIAFWSLHHRSPLANTSLTSSLDTKPISQVELKDKEIKESSGLARSLHHSNCFWTHNDSGDGARLFLVDREGETQSEIQLDVPNPIDWEDMASFNWDGEAYLAVGDIGGNAQPRKTVSVYLFPEPKVELNGKKKKKKVDVPITVEISIEGGITNFESMAVDASTNSILLVEKSNFGGRVFSILLDHKQGVQQVTGKVIGQVPIALTTACDVSSDGHKMAIISYSVLYLYERVEKDGKWSSWGDAIKKPTMKLRLPKLEQAEAVCFGPDGDRVFLTSEQLPTPLVEMSLDSQKK